MRTPAWVTAILYIGGIVNIFGILLVTQGLTDETIANLYPQVFSRTGQISILLWGLAYIGCARGVAHVPGLLLVFTIEKLFYVGTWLAWAVFGSADLRGLLSEPSLANLFMLSYGANDLFFAVMFFLGFIACQRNPPAATGAAESSDSRQ